MGISFSTSLFGLAGSLILGFLDLQSSQAQNRFYTDLEDWLATTVREYGSGRGRRRAGGSGAAGEHAQAAVETLARGARGRQDEPAAAPIAMASLAEAIQGLVRHMRTEQQMIREWADGQAEQNREIRRLLERSRASRKSDELSCPLRRSLPLMRAEPGPIARERYIRSLSRAGMHAAVRVAHGRET